LLDNYAIWFLFHFDVFKNKKVTADQNVIKENKTHCTLCKKSRIGKLFWKIRKLLKKNNKYTKIKWHFSVSLAMALYESFSRNYFDLYPCQNSNAYNFTFKIY